VADLVIMELAVNGATPRRRNRHGPRDPGEIAEVALAGVELGASIMHSHNDEPMFTPDGIYAAGPYLASWGPVLERYPDLLM
jgi:3-keto-5-aminohexanoate cleavage enzyme